MLSITNSEIVAFDLCKQKWQFQYNERLTPKKRSWHLDFGSAVHHGLEAFYRRSDPLAAVRAYHDEIARKASESGIPLSDDHSLKLRMAAIYIEAYIEIYKNDFDRYNIVSVEVPFEVKHPKAKWLTVRGKMDLLLTDRSDGTFMTGEHKTVTSWDSDVNRLMLDQQVNTYAWAMSRMLKVDSAVFFYNVIKKPSIRVRQDESEDAYLERLRADLVDRADFYFHRDTVRRTSHEIERVGEELYRRALDMKRLIKDKSGIYRSPGDHCNRFCAFREVCLENTEMMREMMYDVREHRHQELAEETSEAQSVVGRI